MSNNAVALRDFRVGENPGVLHAKGDLIRDLPANQFSDWQSVELVRAATEEELAPPAPEAPAEVEQPTPAEPAAPAAPAEEPAPAPVQAPPAGADEPAAPEAPPAGAEG